MLKNISIKYKLFLSFLLLAILILPVSYFALHTLTQLKIDVFDIVDNSVPRIEALLEMKNNAIQVGSLVDRFAMATPKSQLEIDIKKDELLAYLEEMNRWANEYKINIASDSSSLDLNQFIKLRDNVVFNALQAFSDSAKGEAKQQIQLSISKLYEAQKTLNAFIENATFNETLNLENKKNTTNFALNRIQRFTYIVNVMVLTVALILSIILSQYISRPIIRLRNFTQNISMDETKERAPVDTGDEIGHLSQTINSMLDHLYKAKNDLLDASRQAGKAEVATSILHNVGNILNSVIVGTHLMLEKNTPNQINNLTTLANSLQENIGNIQYYLTEDERGKLIIPYLKQLSNKLMENHDALNVEINMVIKKLEDIKNIIMMQQSYTRVTEVKQLVFIPQLIDEVLEVFNGKIRRFNIDVDKFYPAELTISCVKTKLQQILVNLVKNGIESLIAAPIPQRQLSINIKNHDENHLKIIIRDNGMGIDPENLNKIFSFGYTTKQNGHGYGLHSCALLAKELGGSLTAESLGLEKGACFILTIASEDTASLKKKKELCKAD